MGNKYCLVFDFCTSESYFKLFLGFYLFIFLMTKCNLYLLTVWKRILVLFGLSASPDKVHLLGNV